MQPFSIVICTHNPNFEILKRLLYSLLNFNTNSPTHEVIIVDNNSEPGIQSNSIVEDFLIKKTNSRLIQEKNPGLTAARIAGINKSKYDWIVFFDDDNEPDFDYLIEARVLIENHPQVGAWGPGQLTVNYFKRHETNFLKKIKWLFQERNYKLTYFDNNIIEGSEYYPFGTGMIIKKEALVEYISRVEAGRYSMSDRKGKSLTSAGDMQILFTCLQMGYYAGSSHHLKLTHLIVESKANPRYAAKLVYALNSCQLKAYKEVFTDYKINVNPITNYEILKVVYSALRLYRLNQERYTRKMYLGKRLGELNARLIAFDVEPPLLLRLFATLIYV
jgi:glycosyltransferase involved in cell wall biosynthesis